MGVPVGTIYTPIEERFWAKVRKTANCWLWLGYVDPAGYGKLQGAHGEGVLYAHRFAYELLVGPIPEGFTIDHVRARGCLNRHCVNPAHLEAVTMGENARRGHHPGHPGWGSGRCAGGHDVATEGCFVKGRYIYCKACRRERRLADRERMGRPTL